MSRKNDEAAIQEGKFSASQPLEIAQSREGISEPAPRISPPPFLWGGSGVGLLGSVDEALEVSGGGVPTPYPPRGSGQGRSTVKSKGNFPPRKALKSLETAKESRSRRRGFSLPRSYGEGSGVGLFGIGRTADRSSRRLRSSRQTRAAARLALANPRQPA